MEVLGFFLSDTGIGVCEVRPDGRLKWRCRAPLKRAGNVERLFAVDPKGKWLCLAPGFDGEKEGWTLDSVPREPTRKKTEIAFYRIDNAGRPRYCALLRIPGIALQLVACPTGRRLLVNGGNQVVSVGVSDRGIPRLEAVRKETGSYSFSDIGGERDATHLTLSPDGRWAFVFDGDGFSDHAENYLQVYKIGGNGALHPVEPQRSNNGEGIQEAAGPAELMADGATALVKIGPRGGGYQSLRFQNGLLTGGAMLDSRMQGWRLDPRGRFIYGFCSDATIVYRRKAPGILTRVAAFTGIGGLVLEPLGRFAYDLASPLANQTLPSVRTWSVLPDGRLRCLRRETSWIVPQDLLFAARRAS